MRLPLDKSWIKCITVLEMQEGYGSDGAVRNFLNSYPDNEMSDDVKACRDVLNALHNKSNVFPVRNFRSLAVALTCLKSIDRNNILLGSQLRRRKLIDENSSQLKSAKMLTGKKEQVLADYPNIHDMPYHVYMAYEAETFRYDKTTIYREDRTLTKQFAYFINKLQDKDTKLEVNSAEDVPLAYMFGEIELSEIKSTYPQMVNHESNRIDELNAVTRTPGASQIMYTDDHRIVMACEMFGIVNDSQYKFMHPECVNKSFPNFFKYIKEITDIYKPAKF